MKVVDLIPDDKNFNEGTDQGKLLLEQSLRQLGAGRSVLIDKDNRIIAGNKTVGAAIEIGIDDLIIVESKGDTIVAVKRTDLDLNTKKGREMALADNSIAKNNILLSNESIQVESMKYDIDTAGWGIIDNSQSDFTHSPNETTIECPNCGYKFSK